MDALRENFLIDLNNGTAAAHVYFNLQKLAQTHYDLLNLVCQLSGGGQNERLSYLPTWISFMLGSTSWRVAIEKVAVLPIPD